MIRGLEIDLNFIFIVLLISTLSYLNFTEDVNK